MCDVVDQISYDPLAAAASASAAAVLAVGIAVAAAAERYQLVLSWLAPGIVCVLLQPLFLLNSQNLHTSIDTASWAVSLKNQPRLTRQLTAPSGCGGSIDV